MILAQSCYYGIMKLKLTKTMTNGQIAEVFKFISEILGLEEGNLFRTKAYQEAAEVIAQWNEPLVDIYADHTDEEILQVFIDMPGIGEGIAKKLVELFSTGKIKSFAKYVEELPEGMFELCQVAGIGAKKAYRICSQLPVHADRPLADVLALAKEGRIRKLEGFGEKSEAELIKAIENYQASCRMPYEEANRLAEEIVWELKKDANLEKIEVLGSLRRKNSSIGDIDLGIVTNDLAATKEFVKNFKLAKRSVILGDGLMRLQLKNGHQVDIKVSPLNEWGSFLQHFTGSKEHNIKLRRFALSKGFSLSEHGILIKATNEVLTFANETKFYNHLGLNLIPPAERIGGDEIERYQL